MARPRTDIEPRIVHAARERFLTEGVDGASLRRIARDAGTSIGMLYYYFPTKDELFLAVVEEVYAELLAEITATLSPDVPVEERLRRLYTRIAAVSDTEMQIIKLVIREALVSSTRLHSLIARFQRGHLPLVLATLLDGVRDGTLSPSVPPALMLPLTFAIGAVPQLLRRNLGDRPPFDALPEGTELAEILLGVLYRGIGAPR